MLAPGDLLEKTNEDVAKGRRRMPFFAERREGTCYFFVAERLAKGFYIK